MQAKDDRLAQLARLQAQRKQALHAEIAVALQSADKFCCHGSLNYRNLQIARTKFHYLLTKLLSPKSDFAQVQEMALANVTSLNDNQSPYNLDSLLKKITPDVITFFKERLDFSTDEIALFKAFIAEVLITSLSQSQQFIGEYNAEMKLFRGIPSGLLGKFYQDHYLNGLKAMVYGFGGCELRADALFVELLRTGTMKNLSLVELNPCSRDGENLEELHCVVVGQWPQPGCIIIAPWLRDKRVFDWNGSLENTPELAKALCEPRLSCERSTWQVHLQLDGDTIAPMRQVTQDHHSYVMRAHDAQQKRIDWYHDKLTKGLKLQSSEMQQLAASVRALHLRGMFAITDQYVDTYGGAEQRLDATGP